MPLTKKDFEDTLTMLNACNASALILDLAKIMPRIWEEARVHNKGTDWVAKHPITLLWISKIGSLQHGRDAIYDMWELAYNYCQMRAGVWSGIGPIWTVETEYRGSAPNPTTEE
jgi:hypothetical protein